MHMPIVQGICASDRFLMISCSVYVNMVLVFFYWGGGGGGGGFFIVQMLFLLYF